VSGNVSFEEEPNISTALALKCIGLRFQRVPASTCRMIAEAILSPGRRRWTSCRPSVRRQHRGRRGRSRAREARMCRRAARCRLDEIRRESTRLLIASSKMFPIGNANGQRSEEFARQMPKMNSRSGTSSKSTVIEMVHASFCIAGTHHSLFPIGKRRVKSRGAGPFTISGACEETKRSPCR
jgi:hypothetical protein